MWRPRGPLAAPPPRPAPRPAPPALTPEPIPPQAPAPPPVRTAGATRSRRDAGATVRALSRWRCGGPLGSVRAEEKAPTDTSREAGAGPTPPAPAAWRRPWWRALLWPWRPWRPWWCWALCGCEPQPSAAGWPGSASPARAASSPVQLSGSRPTSPPAAGPTNSAEAGAGAGTAASRPGVGGEAAGRRPRIDTTVAAEPRRECGCRGGALRDVSSLLLPRLSPWDNSRPWRRAPRATAWPGTSTGPLHSPPAAGVPAAPCSLSAAEPCPDIAPSSMSALATSAPAASTAGAVRSTTARWLPLPAALCPGPGCWALPARALASSPAGDIASAEWAADRSEAAGGCPAASTRPADALRSLRGCSIAMGTSPPM